MKFEKNDLVYIPILGTEIYTIEDVVDNRIVINGSFVEFYTNFHVYEKYKDNEPIQGNFNYRTGYLTNEGKVLIGVEMPTKVFDDQEEEEKIKEYVGNISSKFVYEVNLKNHRLLEELTGDKYQAPYSPLEVTVKLLQKGNVICKASNDLQYKELLEVTDFKLIVRYDENNNLFYDDKEQSYTTVIPVDESGREIKELVDE